ncbi:MAG: MORN repeat-containing protein [Luteibaculaceae bacterium]
MKNNLFVVLTVLLVVASGYLFYYYAEKIEKLEDTIENNSDLVTSYESQVRAYKLKNIADSLFIRGNFDEAFVYYKQFDELQINSESMEAHRRAVLMDVGNRDSSYRLNGERLRYRVAALTKKLDSLQNKVSFKDSALTFKDKENRRLTNLISAQRDSVNRLARRLQIPKQDTLTFMASTGNMVRYHGFVDKNKANGTGSGFWSTGGFYYGEWKNNMRHGKGMYIWKEGHRYDGDFYMDKRQGYGVYRWLNGEKYEGQWKDNVREGNGTLFSSDGSIKYTGVWIQDKPKN